ncbi:MAG: hypothetical protein OHK0039_33940 [Bacteroidia bacterium]
MYTTFSPEGTTSSGSVEVANTYPVSPRLYAWYDFAGHRGWLGHTQASLGLRYGRSASPFEVPGNVDMLLPGGETVVASYLSASPPHHLWSVEASWTGQILKHEAHGLFAGLYLMKGLSSLMTTTHVYTVGAGGAPQESRLTLRGDYIGVGVSYRWQARSGT